MNFIRGTVKNGSIAFGDNVFDLSRKLKNISAWEGKEIVFGFRPEAIRLKDEGEEAYKVVSQVELTEMLGDNTNVYITSGGVDAILKVDSHDTPETDVPITFNIPLKSVYLFDGETEKVIKE